MSFEDQQGLLQAEVIRQAVLWWRSQLQSGHDLAPGTRVGRGPLLSEEQLDLFSTVLMEKIVEELGRVENGYYASLWHVSDADEEEEEDQAVIDLWTNNVPAGILGEAAQQGRIPSYRFPSKVTMKLYRNRVTVQSVGQMEATIIYATSSVVRPAQAPLWLRLWSGLWRRGHDDAH